LERQQGADAGGYSGLEDEVDNHWAELLKAALLSTILGVGAELGSGAGRPTRWQLPTAQTACDVCGFTSCLSNVLTLQ
jgi:type IV secretory pathway VirB10-like protein